jgi:hypothetical protein
MTQAIDNSQFTIENSQFSILLPPLWRDLLFWLTLALTVFAVAPLLLPGYFWGANDARHHVYFLFEYDRLVQDGIWWPRWSPDFAFGYGYPFFNIYGLFSHFLAEILLHFFHFTYTAAIESVFGLSIVASAGAMYAFVRSWVSRPAALIAGLVYVYTPYHLLNLYVRANLAESMAFVWLPLCLWTARETIVRGTRRGREGESPIVNRQSSIVNETRNTQHATPGFPVGWVIGLAVSYAGLMLTSNLVIVLFTPMLAGYVLVLTLVYALPDGANGRGLSLWRKLGWWVRRCVPPALGLIAGLGLSAVFWLPMLLERRFVRVDQWFDGRYDFHGHFVYFYQLFSPLWGFGVSIPGPGDPISFQIGAVALVFAVLGILLVWRTAGRLRWEIAYLVLVGIIAMLLTTNLAAPLWDMPLIGGILQSAQFPWRWLVLTALCVSLLAGLIAHPAILIDRAGVTTPLLALATVVILGSYPYLRVQITEPAEGPVNLAGLMRFQQSSDEMTGSTAWVKEIPTWSSMADYYMSEAHAGGPVNPVDTKLDYTIFDYKTLGASSVAHNTVSEEIYYYNGRETPETIVFNQFYYPGWNAYLLDGQHGRRVQQIPIVPESTGTLGRMTVAVPPDEGYLLLIYEDTPPRTIGGIISLLTAGLLLVAGLVAVWRSRRAAHLR